MTVTLKYNDLKIELYDESEVPNTPGSSIIYDRIYHSDRNEENNSVSQTGIVVYRNDVKVISAILLANAGATSVTADSTLIDNGNLITRCCNTVFSLSLPDLTLNWMTIADWATCFSIHKYKDTFITHGELSISRIDTKGKILWQYSGADIFVTLNKGTPFKMHNSYIALTDFYESRYKIDYKGNLLSYKESTYNKQKPVSVNLKSEKPWLKLW